MKLIAVTTPDFWPGEAGAITALLAHGGFCRVHIRKPGADAAQIESLLEAIPGELRHRLSLHDCLELAAAGLAGGVHLNSRNPVPPEGFNGIISRSCHSLEEVRRHAAAADYLFLSPIFDSISKTGYKGAFSTAGLKSSGVITDKVIALGGVTPERIPDLEHIGFGGAAMLGAAWRGFRDNTHSDTISNQHKSPKQLKNFRLQFITDRIERLEDTLRGGCRWVQLRMKEVTENEYIETGRKALAICRRYGATFIVDDRVEAAMLLGADGVHLGKNDMPAVDARQILGPRFIIGATANTFEDIRHAAEAGADYIGLGPYRFTTTKKNLSPVLGTEGYRRIMDRCRLEGINLPVTAIGGILTDDIPEIMHTGVSGVAVSGLILNSTDSENTTQQVISTIDKWKNS